MKLEDLRKDNLGEVYFWFPEKGSDEDSMLLFTYHNYSIKAFTFSCQTLEQLEQSKGSINQGTVNINAIGSWFFSIEAFINTVLKVACLSKKQDFMEFKGKTLNSRLSSVFDLLEIERREFYRSGVFQKLEDFKTFRNEVFHDRFFNSEIDFCKTSFSSVPYMANQVDVMQASIISLELFQSFRYIYSGLDLMPSIWVQKKDSYGYLKYDVLYKKLMLPLFSGAMAKHKLTTDLQMQPIEFNLPESPIIKKGDIGVTMRVLPRDDLFHAANDDETRLAPDLYRAVGDLIDIDDQESFQMPAYYK